MVAAASLLIQLELGFVHRLREPVHLADQIRVNGFGFAPTGGLPKWVPFEFLLEATPNR